jgi:[protein-PII] uridylyltransferase
VNASSLVRRVSRPDLLLLAAVLHDIGKGPREDERDHADHAVVGAELCVPWLRRMGLPDSDVTVITTLIRHHLLLGDSAARRDPDDPATIATVVEAVGDVETLDLLAALTESDARAAGPAAWTTWRAGQIRHLVTRVRRALAGERPAEPPELTQVERELIEAGGVGIVIEQIPAALRLTICAPDRAGLLAASAAVLTMHRLTVRSAAIRTVDGTAVQTWIAAPQFGEAPAAATLRADLVRALDGSLDVAARLARRAAPPRRGPAVPPEVRLIADASATSTVIEVRAHDLPGLLYKVSTVLTAAGVSVVGARVDTLGADAVDVFYVQTPAGAPLSGVRARAIADEITQALA